ncbi:hypothetical protein ACFWXO_30860 [Kitasatospora sp. NPDC059088]|uniref:hypothetical protein n=1 Tax=Kitasatospora sp. NPDC059088 TaxID=3346722 RepID=UPI003690E2FB
MSSSAAVLHPVAITGDDETVTTLYIGIVSVEIRREPGFFGAERHGLYAHVEVATRPDAGPNERSTKFVSRLVGESDWAVDAAFSANGFPQHSNGFGARYLRYRTLRPEVAALVDSAAVERGVAMGISADIALTLPPQA